MYIQFCTNINKKKRQLGTVPGLLSSPFLFTSVHLSLFNHLYYSHLRSPLRFIRNLQTHFQRPPAIHSELYTHSQNPLSNDSNPYLSNRRTFILKLYIYVLHRRSIYVLRFPHSYISAMLPYPNLYHYLNQFG